MFTDFVIINMATNFISGSPSFFGLVGAKNHSPLLSLIDENDRTAFWDGINSLKTGEVFGLVTAIKNSLGDYVPVYMSISLYEKKDEEKSTEFYIEYTRLDRLHQGLTQYRIYSSAYRKILGIYKNPIFEYDPQTQNLSIYAIDQTAKHSMYSGNIDKLCSQFLSDNLIAQDYKPVFRDLINDIKNCVPDFRYELVNAISTGGSGNVLDTITGGAVINNNRASLVIGTFFNNSNRISSENSNKFEKDPMTGLLNKTSILTYAKDRINLRNDENVIMAIIDMDNFKDINDNLGHAFGDRVINRFAEIISSVIDGVGVAGRFGGDEFMVVLTGVPDITESRSYFRSIRSNVENEFRNLAEGLSMTCSMGIVSCPRDGTEFNSLFALADRCLYLAKDFGKNRYVFPDERSRRFINEESSVGSSRKERVSDNNDFLLEMNKALFSENEKAIPYVLDKINKHFNLTRTKIYIGEDMSLKYYAGTVSETNDKADYVFSDKYTSRFDNNNMYVMEKVSEVQVYCPTAYQSFLKRNVDSVIQHLIKDNNKIKGLISYELIPPGRCWHDEDIDYISIFSQLIGHILTK